MSELRIVSHVGANQTKTNTFSVNNFVITETRYLPKRIPLDENFIFHGMAILICLKGSGKFQINHRDYTVSENQILVILPYQIVRLIGRAG